MRSSLEFCWEDIDLVVVRHGNRNEMTVRGVATIKLIREAWHI